MLPRPLGDHGLALARPTEATWDGYRDPAGREAPLELRGVVDIPDGPLLAWVHVLSFTDRDARRGRTSWPRPRSSARRELRRGAPLLDWYERVRRPLPWRATRDPYALLVSRGDAPADPGGAGRAVLRGVPGALPRRRPRSPARPAADVLAAWSGLGYNRRALALQRGRARGRRARLAGGPARSCRASAPYTAAAVGLVRVGRAGRGGRHQRAPRDRAPRRRRARAARAGRPRGGAAARGPGGAVQPGDDGARRDGLPPAPAALRRLPGARGLRAAGREPRRRRAARAPASASRTPTAGRAGGSSPRWWPASSRPPLDAARRDAGRGGARCATASSSAAPMARCGCPRYGPRDAARRAHHPRRRGRGRARPAAAAAPAGRPRAPGGGRAASSSACLRRRRRRARSSRRRRARRCSRPREEEAADDPRERRLRGSRAGRRSAAGIVVRPRGRAAGEPGLLEVVIERRRRRVRHRARTRRRVMCLELLLELEPGGVVRRPRLRRGRARDRRRAGSAGSPVFAVDHEPAARRGDARATRERNGVDGRRAAGRPARGPAAARADARRERAARGARAHRRARSRRRPPRDRRPASSTTTSSDVTAAYGARRARLAGAAPAARWARGAAGAAP